MKIGIDIDGVLTNLSEFQLKKGLQFFKKIHNYHGYEIKDIFNCNRIKQTEFWLKNIDYFNMPPRNGASELTYYLHSKEYEVFIISARSELLKPYTQKWLKNNNIYYDTIIFSKDKLKTIKDNNVNIIIEDSPKNILSLSKEIPVIFIQAPYNKTINIPNTYQIASFNEIYDIIDNLNNKTL